MELPKEEKEQLITDMLTLLDPAAQKAEPTVINLSGAELMRIHKVFKDKTGRQIEPWMIYNINSFKAVPVNHREEVENIIDTAPDREAMEQALAAHLTTYHKDRPTRTN